MGLSHRLFRGCWQRGREIVVCLFLQCDEEGVRVWSIAKPIASFFSGLLRVLSLGKVEPLEGEISQKHLCVVTPVCVCVCMS